MLESGLKATFALTTVARPRLGTLCGHSNGAYSSLRKAYLSLRMGLQWIAMLAQTESQPRNLVAKSLGAEGSRFAMASQSCSYRAARQSLRRRS